MTNRSPWPLCWAFLVALVTSVPVRSQPLNVPPGQDPGSTAIAVITPPFQLNAANVVATLARDGEGIAIGWDFSKRPKTAQRQSVSQGTSATPDIVTSLARQQNLRLVATFVDPLRPETWAQAVAFVAQTPARIVLIPFATTAERDWIAFRAAAEHFQNLLFIVPAQSTDDAIGAGAETGAGQSVGAKPAYPAAFHLSNVLSVSPHTPADADVVVATTPQSATSDAALALTVKTLLFCQAEHKMAQPSVSKLQAMAHLGTLKAPQSATTDQMVGPPPFTPCAEALN